MCGICGEFKFISKSFDNEKLNNLMDSISARGNDSQGRYNIVGVDPDDGLYVYNKDGQSSYQWNLGFKYEF